MPLQSLALEKNYWDSESFQSRWDEYKGIRDVGLLAGSYAVYIGATKGSAAVSVASWASLAGITLAFTSSYLLTTTAPKIFDQEGRLIGVVSDGMLLIHRQYEEYFSNDQIEFLD